MNFKSRLSPAKTILILTTSDERGKKLMTDNVVCKLKDALEGIFSDKKTLIRILSIVLILLFAVILRIHEESKADVTIESADTDEEIEYREDENSTQVQVLFVDIGGAVENPGVYQVSKDTGLFEVIEMAGGLTGDADTDHVNRASFVEDGQKIIIPVKGLSESDIMPAADSVAPAADNGLVNINTASADELKTLNGIGDVMAERIIEYRSSNAFKSKEDVMSVDGIGSKIYEKIKDHITV